ncbi:MAG: type II toxin-antitoxin system RelE/ParE family toxin [Geitlerinemataceae cyanobacterium]
MYEIETYVTPDDRRCPFDEWLERLDRKIQARVEDRLDRVQDGNFGDRRPVGDEVYELRLMFGAGYRIYFGIANGQVVLLLGGGSKKRQNRDIQDAKSCWAEFKSR